MKTQNHLIYISLAFLLGLGVYNACLFIVFTEFSDVFWVSYAFTTVAFLAQILSGATLFLKGKAMSAGSYLRLATSVVAEVYFLIQLITGFVLLLNGVSLTVSLVVEILLFAVYLFTEIAMAIANTSIIAVEDDVKNAGAFIKSLKASSESICCQNFTEDKKELLLKMNDVIKYSEPLSRTNDARILDEQIRMAFNTACANIEYKSTEQLSQEVENVITLINRRNVVCKVNG